MEFIVYVYIFNKSLLFATISSQIIFTASSTRIAILVLSPNVQYVGDVYIIIITLFYFKL